MTVIISSDTKLATNILSKTPAAYCLTIGDCKYYGSTGNVRKRFYTHRSKLRNNIHESTRMQSHWNSMDTPEFKMTVIGTGTAEECKATEDLLLEQHHGLDSCLNSKKAKDKLSDETKAKVSASLMGKKHSAEHKAKIGAANKGRRSMKCWGKPKDSDVWVEFPSRTAAAKHVGGYQSDVSKVIKGKQKTCKGWVFTGTEPDNLMLLARG